MNNITLNSIKDNAINFLHVAHNAVVNHAPQLSASQKILCFALICSIPVAKYYLVKLHNYNINKCCDSIAKEGEKLRSKVLEALTAIGKAEKDFKNPKTCFLQKKYELDQAKLTFQRASSNLQAFTEYQVTEGIKFSLDRLT